MPDPAVEVVGVVMEALSTQFQIAPDKVRFFAGDGPALAAWDSHASQSCADPFVWVLAQRRYRSQTFPAPATDTTPCGLTRVLQVQIGVGRCVSVDEVVSWETYASEAARSLADSYAIECALDKAASALGDIGLQTATDTLLPYGPEGGITAWTGVIYSSL